MKTLAIESIKIKKVKSAHAELTETRSAIERINKRIESGKELNDRLMNLYNIITFCIESEKEIIADYIEAGVVLGYDDYNEGIKTVKKGM